MTHEGAAVTDDDQICASTKHSESLLKMVLAFAAHLFVYYYGRSKKSRVTGFR